MAESTATARFELPRTGGPRVPELVVADLGGTLVAEGDLVVGAVLQALEGAGLGADRKLAGRLRGRNQRDVLRAAAAEAGLHPYAVEQGITAFADRVVADLLDGRYRLLPGVGEALARLRHAGVGVVVTTNFAVGLRDVLLAVTGLAAHVVGAVSAEEADGEDPQPFLTRLAMQQAGVGDPAVVAAVGDTVRDLDAAADAGVGWNVAVLTGRATAEELAREGVHVVADFPAAVDLLLSG